MSMPTSAFDLKSYLAAEWEAVEAARRELSDRLLRDVPASIAEPVRYALDAGGKRLRPILCVVAYRAVLERAGHGAGTTGGERGGAEGEEGAGIYDIATALEFIHTYSLIHDDLPCMDDDDLRRGHPTTHRVYGVPAATIAGAALIPLACRAVEEGGVRLGLEPAHRTELVRTLCHAAGAAGMIGGQWLDLAAEGKELDLVELQGVHKRKTGALLAVAARLGGLAARAEPRMLDALETYGQALGLAFQIADDILDLTGDTAQLGKVAGRDLTLGKATYPSLLGVERARQRAREEAERAIAALRDVGLDTTPLRALAGYAVERDR